MKIAVVSVQVPFVRGGAEYHANNLIVELSRRGFETDLITFPFKWYPPQAIIESMAIARMLDLSEANGAKIDRVIGLKFPAYLIPHPNKVLWILHQYRTAYELWDHTDFGDLIRFPDGRAVRDAIHHADTTFIPEAKAVFANSQNVADRLYKYNRILAPALYHPPGHAELFCCAEPQNYLYYPSRITQLKRHHLVIEALALCRQPVHIVFSGTAESKEYQHYLHGEIARHGLTDRVTWKGFVSEQQKRDLYANAKAVIYPPIDEDYGYVTLEAMLSAKAVLTTGDAGGPLEFVIPGETGLVANPEPSDLAAMMDEAWLDSQRLIEMGANGRAHYRSMGISWDNVIGVLTS